MRLAVVRLTHASDLPLPSYATAGSAGLDLLAAIDADVELAPGARSLVPCGIAIALPLGFEAQVRPRSGLALKHGVTLLNTPGTIDSDYRGEIKATLINHGGTAFLVKRGMKIAQLVVSRHETVELEEVQELPASERGTGGFGSTGLMHASTGRKHA
ncbi:MAG: dUTP diphosphatase [Alphaproteobacteria bacterium]|nr:dUTP diphosphatase [Alphaproteobacteria bacterium]